MGFVITISDSRAKLRVEFCCSGLVEFDGSQFTPGLNVDGLPDQLGPATQACILPGGSNRAGNVFSQCFWRLNALAFGNPYPIGPYEVFGSIQISPSNNPVLGCTYYNAANYLAYATEDDGSCLFWVVWSQKQRTSNPLQLMTMARVSLTVRWVPAPLISTEMEASPPLTCSRSPCFIWHRL